MSELENTIAEESKIRLDKIKAFYSRLGSWILFVITAILIFIAFQFSPKHQGTFLEPVILVVSFIALICTIVIISPILSYLIIPILLKTLMLIGTLLKQLFTIVAGVIAEISRHFKIK